MKICCVERNARIKKGYLSESCSNLHPPSNKFTLTLFRNPSLLFYVATAFFSLHNIAVSPIAHHDKSRNVTSWRWFNFRMCSAIKGWRQSELATTKSGVQQVGRKGKKTVINWQILFIYWMKKFVTIIKVKTRIEVSVIGWIAALQ